LKIENCKLKIANWARRATLAGFALSGLCLFTGCPAEQVVTVVMRPDAGAASPASAEETEGSTTAAGFGNLVGTVTFEGPPRNLPPLVAKDDPKVKPDDRAVCAAEPIPDESLLVNHENKGLANVIVFLEKRPANIKPELAKPPSDPILFDQKGCRFLPHIVLLQAGQPLLVVSGDPIPHNTHTDPKRNTGFNQVIKPEDRKGTPIEYKKPEAGPIEVRCDYHPWMKAYHFPLDHPHAALTDKDGKFRIEGLPAGTHAFNVWHERGPGSGRLLERKLQIKIEADKDTTKDLNYASTKFASVPGPLPRAVAYERLLEGGPIELTQTEEQR
jgi:hypothetical protein